MQYSVRIGLLAGGPGFPYGFSHKIPPEGETQMAYSLYDAAVTPCAQQLGALAGIIDKAAAHCATNKIEESALLQDRLYPDMFCLARQIRQSADFAMNTGGRLAGVTPPAMPAVDDTSFAAAKSRVETALGFVKSLTRAQVDGAEGKVIAGTGGGNEGQRLSATVRPAEFLLLCNDGVQHPASSRRTARKAGLPRPGQLALGRLEVLRCTSAGSGRRGNCRSARAVPKSPQIDSMISSVLGAAFTVIAVALSVP